MASFFSRVAPFPLRSDLIPLGLFARDGPPHALGHLPLSTSRFSDSPRPTYPNCADEVAVSVELVVCQIEAVEHHGDIGQKSAVHTLEKAAIFPIATLPELGGIQTPVSASNCVAASRTLPFVQYRGAVGWQFPSNWIPPKYASIGAPLKPAGTELGSYANTLACSDKLRNPRQFSVGETREFFSGNKFQALAHGKRLLILRNPFNQVTGTVDRTTGPIAPIVYYISPGTVARTFSPYGLRKLFACRGPSRDLFTLPFHPETLLLQSQFTGAIHPQEPLDWGYHGRRC